MTYSLEQLTDEQLAVLYSNGDNDAFDLLLERVKGGLFSYILVVVHNRELAEDIFQDTFVKIIITLQEGKYSDNGKFSAWVIRIAHNVILDYYRKQKVQNIFDANYGDDMSRFSHSLLDDSKEQSIVSSQVLEDAKRLMNNLPEQQREVVYMRCFQGIPFKEISEMTGVSINTALGRMRYGIINMRKMAKEHNMALEF